MEGIQQAQLNFSDSRTKVFYPRGISQLDDPQFLFCYEKTNYNQ